jgi:hypothetical protein
MPTLSKSSFARLFVLLAPLALAHCASGAGALGDDCSTDSNCKDGLSCHAIGAATVLQCTAPCQSDSDCSALPTPAPFLEDSTPACDVPAGWCVASSGPP